MENLIAQIKSFNGPLIIQNLEDNHVDVLTSAGVVGLTVLPTGRVRDHFEGDTIIHANVDAAFAYLTA